MQITSLLTLVGKVSMCLRVVIRRVQFGLANSLNQCGLSPVGVDVIGPAIEGLDLLPVLEELLEVIQENRTLHRP
jgi:hypothetical protein